MSEPKLRPSALRMQGARRYQPRFSVEDAQKRAEQSGADDDDDNNASEENSQKATASGSATHGKSATPGSAEGAKGSALASTKAPSAQSGGASTSNAHSGEHHENGAGRSHPAPLSALSAALSSPSPAFASSNSTFQTPSSDSLRSGSGHGTAGASTKIDRLLSDQKELSAHVQTMQRTLNDLTNESKTRFSRLEAERDTSLDQLLKPTVAALNALPPALEQLLAQTRQQASLIDNLTKLASAQQEALQEVQQALAVGLTSLRSDIKSQTAHHTDLELELLRREQSSFASINRMVIGQAVLWLFVLVLFVAWVQQRT